MSTYDSVPATPGYIVDGTRHHEGETITVTDPATREGIATVPEAGPEGVDAALAAANAVSGEWATCNAVERGRTLRQIADLIREEASRIGTIETYETGRPVSDSIQQVESAADYFEYYAGQADKIEGRQIPIPGPTDRVDYTVREPYGVTAHIVPWNASFVLAARSFAPALAAGNTIVAKAPTPAPLSLLELTDLAHRAGLPDGVLNTVTGSGSSTGDALLSDGRVAAIEFTGSTQTGRRVMRTAADGIRPVHLELGGKGANIIFEDADVEGAVDSIGATFANAGQICFAPTRVFVQSGVYETVVDRAVEHVESMTLGPGIEDPDMGPLISADAQATVSEYVEQATADGARVLTGGSIPREDGNFYEPTLLTDVADDAPVSCDEIFGPVLTVYEFETADEAVGRANDTQYGLNNVVWTSDLTRAHDVAGRLESGTVQVNEYPVLSPAAVSGGYKESGLGRSKGQQAIEAFTQTKNVIVSLD